MSEKYFKQIVGEEDRGFLLIDYIPERVSKIKLSKTQTRKYLKDKSVFVESKNQRFFKPRYKLKGGDIICFDWSLLRGNSTIEQKFEIKPFNFPLEVIHEEEGFIIINKPRGLLVHPTNQKKSDNRAIVNILVARLGLENLSKLENDPLRPGIVHRLDRFTSGCLMIMKTVKAHTALKQQLMSHETYIKREYVTLVSGHLDRISGIIDHEIGRHPTHFAKRIAKFQLNRSMEGKKENTFRNARTKYSVTEEMEFEGHKFSLVRCSLFTGRTHQIRVHMSCIGHPIVGDTLYGAKWENQPHCLKKFLAAEGESGEGKSKMNTKKKRKKGRRGKGRKGGPIGGQVLHAEMIEFVHPDSFEEKEVVEEEEDFNSDDSGDFDSENEEKEIGKEKEPQNRVKFVCDPPEYFRNILSFLRENGKIRAIQTENTEN